MDLDLLVSNKHLKLKYFNVSRQFKNNLTRVRIGNFA